MKIRKIMTLILVCALAGSCLAACGGNTDTPAPETEPAADPGPGSQQTPSDRGNEEESPEMLDGPGEIVNVFTTGGWDCSVDPAVTPELQAVFADAMNGLTGVDYTPEAYLGSQVVAGTNHCFLCRSQTVYPNASPYYTLVYVYEDLNGEADLTGIVNLTDAPSDNTSSGGWSAPESSEITEELQAVMDKASEGYDGATLTPIALLEQQVVAGWNYRFLCRIQPAGTESLPYYTLVKVFANLSGGAEITYEEPLDIGALWNTASK